MCVDYDVYFLLHKYSFFAQSNTTFKPTFPPSRNVLTADNNSTLSALSDTQDLQSKLVAKNLENTLQDGVGTNN